MPVWFIAKQINRFGKYNIMEWWRQSNPQSMSRKLTTALVCFVAACVDIQRTHSSTFQIENRLCLIFIITHGIVDETNGNRLYLLRERSYQSSVDHKHSVGQTWYRSYVVRSRSGSTGTRLDGCHHGIAINDTAGLRSFGRRAAGAFFALTEEFQLCLPYKHKHTPVI